MEIKVRALDSGEQKSKQEVEQELLAKHETEQAQAESKESNTQQEEPKQEDKSLSDEDVLSYISERYGKKIESFDELTAERSQSEELPEDVKAYYEYKKQTGRTMEDFLRLNSSTDDLTEDQILFSYYKEVEPDLDDTDIDILISDRFDTEDNNSKDSKRKQVDKKRELAKAKKHFESQKEKYNAPLESRADAISSEEMEAYREYVNQAKTYEERTKRQTEFFNEKTKDIFNDDFKGFEINIGEVSYTYSPGEASQIMNDQSSLNNFVSRYLDDDGMIKDARGYHKALAAAMNPEKFAKFFYEQGRSEAIENDARRAKNINMDVKQAPQFSSKGGFNVRSVAQNRGNGLRIKSIKKT